MIIVFEDDQTVTVLPSLESVRLEYEAVDIEDGAYRFFDERGRRLVPRFIAPVQRGSLLFEAIKTVGGGVFELEPDPQDHGAFFAKSLSSVVAINSNPNFATVADLASYVEDNRKRNGTWRE